MNMKKLVVANAFSINMLAETPNPVNIRFTKISAGLAKQLAQDCEILSVVGHVDTAKVFSSVLGKEMPFNRVNFTWDDDSILLVGQLKGRLPEGATTLPKNVVIEWYNVTRI